VYVSLFLVVGVFLILGAVAVPLTAVLRRR
jgi:hypothetical protein